VALGLYLVMLLVSTWRWQLLLRAQHVQVGFAALMNSFLCGGVRQQLSAVEHRRVT
jgi:hypothetical protein